MTVGEILGWAIFVLLLMGSTFCLIWGAVRVWENADNADFMRGFWAAFIFACGTPAAKFFIGFIIGLIKG